jgi:rod shape-determining protein MreC
MKKISVRSWQSFTIVLIIIGVLVLAMSGLLGQIVGKAVDPLVGVQGWFSTRFQAMVEFFTIPKDAATLRQQNAGLQNEVSQLQSEVLQLKQQLAETDILYALLDFARSKPENTYIAASVIGRDPSPFLNYIILDHGSDNGILKGMPVVTQQGLVGRVDAVTATAARVQLITDPGSIVNVRLQESKTEGQVNGSITGDLFLEMVETSITVQDGDLAVTSGLGGSFPAEILVGQVVSPEIRQGELFQSASIQPSVDFLNLRAVLVISNFTAVDIKPLIPQTTP